MEDMGEKEEKRIILYKKDRNDVGVKVRFEKETAWLSQEQIVQLFGKSQSVVSRHIGNVFKDGEVSEKSNMQKMHIANSDKTVVFYSLDIVLVVGYRVNSAPAIRSPTAISGRLLFSSCIFSRRTSISTRSPAKRN